MKKSFTLALFILLSVSVTSCQSPRLSELEATNVALSTQVNMLQAKTTQQAALPLVSNQAPAGSSAQSAELGAVPTSPPTSLAVEQSQVISPELIYSGAGIITPWSNKTAYPMQLFGAANVRMICDPSGNAEGKMWIDKETEFATCGAKGEAWTPWKQDITIGDHYIYSTNPNDKYEFWTIGSTPFTIRNKFSRSDFIFNVIDPGIYTLSVNLIKGSFNIYLTCQEAQNFNYTITQSTSIPVVLSPATCEIIIRDVAQAKTSKADIEVSLEFTR